MKAVPIATALLRLTLAVTILCIVVRRFSRNRMHRSQHGVLRLSVRANPSRGPRVESYRTGLSCLGF